MVGRVLFFEEMRLPSDANDLAGGGAVFIPCLASSGAMSSATATATGTQDFIEGSFGL